MPPQGPGRLVIISGPSGAGKTTVVRRVLRQCPLPLVPSVSATTRAARPGEVDGVDYHFLTSEEFETRRRRGEFLECVEVFGGGVWYGTLLEEVSSGLRAGKWVVLEIDVQGALSVMQRHGAVISIFVRPSSLEELTRRLRGRGTEDEQVIQRRLQQAQQELAVAGRYDYQVINDNLDDAVQEICEILIREAEADQDA